MSCATLGQDYKEHKKQQGHARRRQEQPEPPRVVTVASTEEVKIRGALRSNYSRTEDRLHHNGEGLKPTVSSDLPPLAGTPLHAAASTAWLDKRYRRPRDKDASQTATTSVVLDGNKVSGSVLAGQGALAGLGEVALFRGCVLPESIAANKVWTRDAFWNKAGRTGQRAWADRQELDIDAISTSC